MIMRLRRLAGIDEHLNTKALTREISPSQRLFFYFFKEISLTFIMLSIIDN